MAADSRRRMCWVRPGCRGEPGIRQAVFRNAQPRRHRFGGSGPGKDGSYEIVGVVENTTYTTVYWKDHAMYFVPLTQRPAVTDPDDPVEKDMSMYAGAIVVQTSRPLSGFEKLAGDTLAASIQI